MIQVAARVSARRSDSGETRHRTCKPNAVCLIVEVKWLLPKPISTQHHRRCRSIPDRRGKHSIQLGKEFVPPFPPSVNQHLGIAVIRNEAVPSLFQFASQLAMVVNTTVEHDGHTMRPLALGIARPTLRHHWLLPICKVDDRQPPVNEGNINHRPIRPRRTVPESPLPIRSAVLDRLVQNIEPRFRYCNFRRRGRARRMDFQNAGDAAHGERVAEPRVVTREPTAPKAAWRACVLPASSRSCGAPAKCRCR